MLKPVGLIIGAVALGGVFPVLAADIYEPPVVEYQPAPIYKEVGGWYIRGDIDYHWSDFDRAEYITYGAGGVVDPGYNTLYGELDGAWSIGAGVGYQVNRYFRTDLTGDYWSKSSFRGYSAGCTSSCGTSYDETSYSAFLLLANAYADLGTYYGVTPYIGAGIGGAHLKWDDLRNTDGNVTVHEGGSSWRFAYALMAGASYCLTDSLNLDVGYRYTHIEGGPMFGLAVVTGPGTDKGINAHEVRGGLRWNFGGNANCAPEQIAFQPEPVFEPVYK